MTPGDCIFLSSLFLDSLPLGQHQTPEQKLRSSHFLVVSRLAGLLLEIDVENVSFSVGLLTVDDTNGVTMLQRNLSLWLTTCI